MGIKTRTDFKLVGLSKGKLASFEFLHTDRETFRAKIDMSDEYFDTLWNFCKGDWKNKKIAIIEHGGLDDNGIPINPLMVDYREWDIEIIKNKTIKK